MFLLARIRKSFIFKIGLLLTFVTLLWLHIGISIYQGVVENEFGIRHTVNSTAFIINANINFSHIELARPSNLSIRELADIFEQENKNQILNLPELVSSWPPNNHSEPWPDGIVIVVQVHDRLTYLRKLLKSLSKSRWIERALLVFSHDMHSAELNRLIRSIPFSASVQIFFPFSLQLFPSTFPGDSPEDCPRDISKDKALATGCVNAEWPDLYGHYREARYSQTKHHWWWKTNFIFEELRLLRNYDGHVVFLEEDHYVAEDFLHVLWLQYQMTRGTTDCPFCSRAHILSLGSYPKAFNHKEDADKVDLLPWVSSRHNMGMVFNRSVWNQFHRCADLFCTIDDYNWDWSLFHVAQKCLPSLQSTNAPQSGASKFILGVLVLRAPRVFHIGECGVHHRKARCSSDSSTLMKAEKSLQIGRKLSTLFPVSLKAKNQITLKTPRLKKSNGGWGDHRDKELCLSLTHKSETFAEPVHQ